MAALGYTILEIGQLASMPRYQAAATASSRWRVGCCLESFEARFDRDPMNRKSPIATGHSETAYNQK